MRLKSFNLRAREKNYALQSHATAYTITMTLRDSRILNKHSELQHISFSFAVVPIFVCHWIGNEMFCAAGWFFGAHVVVSSLCASSLALVKCRAAAAAERLIELCNSFPSHWIVVVRSQRNPLKVEVKNKNVTRPTTSKISEKEHEAASEQWMGFDAVQSMHNEYLLKG